MNLGIVGQAVGLFAVTNIDDILVLSLFFAQGAGLRHSTRRIVIGQYLGFAAILAVAIAAAFGATFLPEAAIPYRSGSRMWPQRLRALAATVRVAKHHAATRIRKTTAYTLIPPTPAVANTGT